MLNHCERETTMVAAVPLSMSPKSRRRAEYTVKQLQTGMMGRARSTITSLADIWKSKSDVGHKATNTNRRTLDVLNVWSRQRRSVSATRSTADVENNNVLMEHNHRNYRRTSYTNLNCESALYPDNDRTSNGSTKENGTNNGSAAQKAKKKGLKRFSRVKSHEFEDEIAKSDFYRSFEENSNDSNELSRRERRQKSWFRTFNEDDPDRWSFEKGKIGNLKSMGKQETVMKARLKFQKFKANDDIILNKTTEMIRPGILYRQNSAAPMLTTETIDLKRKPTTQATTNRLTIDEPKPRKKLSFREPVVSSPDYENFKSKTLPKAEYLLKQYSRRQSIARKESELDDLKLEVSIEFSLTVSLVHSPSYLISIAQFEIKLIIIIIIQKLIEF